MAAWLAVATAASILYQGFDFGINNNASHLAIIDRFRDPGLFPGNPFIDALANYCTAVWWLVKRATFVENLEVLFFALHILARFLTIAAGYLFLRLLVPGRSAALVGAALMALSGALQNFTPVSRSDVFITYANHTSLAIALVLLAFVAALRARYGWAMALSGLALNCNVFMGIWAGGIALAHQLLAGFAAGDDRSGDGRAAARRAGPPGIPPQHPIASLRALLRSGLVFLLMGAPVIGWAGAILLARDGEPSSTAYVTFLRDFFPYHYFIEASVPRAIATHVFAVAAAALAVTQLARLREVVALLLALLIALFTLGAVAPLVATDGILMDLQLMRVETFIHLLAFLAVLAAAIDPDARGPVGSEVRAMRLLAAICVVAGYWPGTVLGLAFGAARQSSATRGGHWPLIVVGAVAVLTLQAGSNAPELYSPRLQGFVLAGGAAACALLARSGLPAFFPLLLALNYAGLREVEGVVMLCMLPWFAAACRPARALAFALAGALAATCILAIGPATREAVFADPGLWFTPRRGDSTHAVQLLAAALAVWGFAACRPIFHDAALLQARRSGQLVSPRILACAALLAFAAPALLSVLAYRLERGSLTNLPPDKHELRGLEHWIAANLPRDAFVLVGFKNDEFSAFARRNYWWGMKYGDGVVGNHRLAEEFAYRKRWQRRFQDQPLAATEPLLLEFAANHGVTHVLVTRAQVSESGRLLPIKQSEHYILYEIPGEPDA